MTGDTRLWPGLGGFYIIAARGEHRTKVSASMQAIHIETGNQTGRGTISGIGIMKIQSNEPLRERRRLNFRSTTELMARRRRIRNRLSVVLALSATLGALLFKFE